MAHFNGLIVPINQVISSFLQKAELIDTVRVVKDFNSFNATIPFYIAKVQQSIEEYPESGLFFCNA